MFHSTCAQGIRPEKKIHFPFLREGVFQKNERVSQERGRCGFQAMQASEEKVKGICRIMTTGRLRSRLCTRPREPRVKAGAEWRTARRGVCYATTEGLAGTSTGEAIVTYSGTLQASCYTQPSPKIKVQKSLWLVWLRWLEHHPVNQKVARLSPGQGACLVCGFGSQSGHVGEATYRCFSPSLPLPSPL